MFDGPIQRPHTIDNWLSHGFMVYGQTRKTCEVLLEMKFDFP